MLSIILLLPLLLIVGSGCCRKLDSALNFSKKQQTEGRNKTCNILFSLQPEITFSESFEHILSVFTRVPTKQFESTHLSKQRFVIPFELTALKRTVCASMVSGFTPPIFSQLAYEQRPSGRREANEFLGQMVYCVDC